MNYITHKGIKLPTVGFGTWCIGDEPEKESREVETMLYGIQQYEMTLIDTAEMYGHGKSEAVVAKVIAQANREELFIVDKILPENAMEHRYEERVRNSLDILGCDYIDLYLLHWRAQVDLQDMVSQMNHLAEIGLIRHWGVSNFDVNDMEDLMKCEGAEHCFANQILYNLSERGVEYDLIEYCRKNDVLMMAYSSMGNSAELQNDILKSPALQKIAQMENKSPYNILLRFAIRNQNIIALAKTSSKKHLDENMKGIDQLLTDEELLLLEKDFPAPVSKVPLHKI